MALMYEVTGYDRQTGGLAVSYDVPERKIAVFKKIAGIGASDDGLGSHPLGPEQISYVTRGAAAKGGVTRREGCGAP